MSRAAGIRVLSALALLAGSSEAVASTRYLCFGDSITNGDGNVSILYPVRLAPKLQAGGIDAVTIVSGVGGERTSAGLSRIDGAMDSSQPDYVLIMEGTNDVFRHISAETAVFNLDAMATKAARRGVVAVHATVVPQSPEASSDPQNVRTGQLNNLIRSMANARGRILADPFSAILGQPSWYSHYYVQGPTAVGHPNASGYDFIAGVFANVLLVRRFTAEVTIDTPLIDEKVSMPFTIRGFAIDPAAAAGPGVSDVKAFLLPPGSSAPLAIGTAPVNEVRPDVGAALGSRFTRSGFRIHASGQVPPGTYSLAIQARSTATGLYELVREMPVRVNTETLRMSVESPVPGDGFGAPFAVSGFALDPASTGDCGVDVVQLYATAPAGSPVFLGDATLFQSSPELPALYGGQFANCRFTATVSTPLSAGPWTLTAVARSSIRLTFEAARDVAIRIGQVPAVWHGFFAVDPKETPFVGDFNGDGKSDIITFTRDNPSAVGDVYVSLSTGSSFGQSAKWHDFFAIDQSQTVVIGDYNGDGRDDIATWLGSTTRQVYVATSFGTGMNTEQLWLGAIGATPADPLFAGDVDGDGRADLVSFSRTSGLVYVARSTGAGFQAPAVWHNFFAVSAYERPRVADVSGDGKADIVTFATDSPTAFGDVYVALSDGTRFGDGQGSTKWHDFFAINPREKVVTGDRDGDGKEDFFTFLPSPYWQAYAVRSLGTAMDANVLIATWAVPPVETDLFFVGDVNGDGRADVVQFAQLEGKVKVLLQ